MSRITLGSNIPSLAAQQQLRIASRDLARILERLSSGLRINRASDDAAGLALASGLETDRRVYAQSVRNLNDAMALGEVAANALEQLNSVVIRLHELATQSANGTLSDTQRVALDQEADALVEEYGRIVESNFNRFPISRIDEAPPVINIRFFPTSHWLIGMGHDRATSVQSAIGDAIFQITGKRYRDLPYGKHDLTWG